MGHAWVYEKVRFVGLRTFDRITRFSSGMVGGFLELEALDGSRWLIPNSGLGLICEHGTQPMFRVHRHRRDWRG
jgi:hypothetical protein